MKKQAKPPQRDAYRLVLKAIETDKGIMFKCLTCDLLSSNVGEEIAAHPWHGAAKNFPVGDYTYT